MGAVITFPEGRRTLREAPKYGARTSASVIILPVIRIEREHEAPPQAGTTKSPSGRKRRGRASPP